MHTIKKQKFYIAFIFLLVILSMLIFYKLFIISFILLVCTYLVYELFCADHIHYNVKEDYNYQYLDNHCETLQIEKCEILIPKKCIHPAASILIEIHCKATIFGYFFDPFIETHCADKCESHYFERCFSGKRILNISHLPISNSSSVKLKLKHCQLITDSCQIITTPDFEISTKKILVLAPHADDAEIAAFGLYSNHNSMVVTITAGEAEPDRQHIAMTENLETASLLKGELRAWDSVAVPLWAGIKRKAAINLGYPDHSLEKLYNNQKTLFPSATQARFRQFNAISLPTDSHPTISWQSLIKDLAYIINHFKPDIVVTPHPELDAHTDHQFSTKAAKQAISHTKQEAIWFYYINHLSNTDRWPFGPHGSAIAPPPINAPINSIYSYPLSLSTQIKKAYSLDMMHDLRKPLKVKYKLRYWLQKKLIGRAVHPLGEEPYLRKSVRSNELFIVETHPK